MSSVRQCVAEGCHETVPDPGPSHCSEQCQMEHLTSMSRGLRPKRYCQAPLCEKTIVTLPLEARYCSKACERLAGVGSEVCAAEDCDQRFFPRHPRQLYCSRACRDRKVVTRESAAAERECAREGCSQGFVPRHPRQLYCTKACQRARADVALRQRECVREDCNVRFVPTHSLQQYHSPECRDRRSRKRSIDERMDRLERMLEQLLERESTAS